jgi:flagellar FliL protein
MTATVTATADPEVAPKKGKQKLILLVVVLLVVTAGGVVGAKLLLGGDAETDVPEAAAPVDGEVVPVAEMTANLAGPATHYAKISFSAVLAEGVDPALITGRFPLLRDAAISELSTFQADHLRTTAGMEELRTRLGERARELFADGEVLRIVFTELVVQ